MRKRVRWLAAIPVAIGLGYLGLVSAESRVDARIAAVATQLHAPPPSLLDSTFWIVRSRVTAIDAYLEQKSKARDGLGVPAMWDSERRAELERGLASLGSFFEQVDALLEEQQCKFVLENGLVTSVDPPLLSQSRHRTNVLCARAFVDLDGPDGPRAAAKRLGQALDLIRLADDGRSMGYSISVAEEGIVLCALHRIVEDGGADGAAIRAELDRRLERLASDGRASKVMSNDVADFAEYDRRRGEPSWAMPWKRVERLVARGQLAYGLETAVRLLHASGKDSRSLHESVRQATLTLGGDFAYARGWMGVADTSHLQLVHVDLARRALDLAAHRENAGKPPMDRYSGNPLHEAETDRGIELRADGALAALNKKPTDSGAQLLSWTIPR